MAITYGLQHSRRRELGSSRISIRDCPVAACGIQTRRPKYRCRVAVLFGRRLIASKTGWNGQIGHVINPRAVNPPSAAHTSAFYLWWLLFGLLRLQRAPKSCLHRKDGCVTVNLQPSALVLQTQIFYIDAIMETRVFGPFMLCNGDLCHAATRPGFEIEFMCCANRLQVEPSVRG